MKYMCRKHGVVDRRPTYPRCAQCAREKSRGRKQTAKRKATMGIGKEGATYKRQRIVYLNTHPHCEHPDGCGAQSTEVHHRPGDEPGTREWLDESRWTPVCHHCHSLLEAELMLRAPDGTWIGKRNAP
jgi:hypothetical protein